MGDVSQRLNGTGDGPALMIDGVLVSASEATVPLDDGLVRGDGVFEGMRLYGRRPRTPEAHMDRLERSAVAVGMFLDRGLVEAELAEFCGLVASPDCGVRLMVTRGGHRIWREEPIPPVSSGVRLLPVPHRVTPLLVGAKTLSYAPNMEAQRRARAAGADEALLVDADGGLVLEGPTTSFAWLEDGVVYFPPLDVGVLDSITRRLTAEAVPVGERRATLADLAGAEGAVIMSTLQEAQPVAEIAGVVRLDPAAPAVTEVREAITAVCRARVVAMA